MTVDNEAELLHQMRTAIAFAGPAAVAEGAPKIPRRGLFVLTCMDARIDPMRLLGLSLGDAHVVRNAGGRVTEDVVRSLALSAAMLGTSVAVVVHHTDCGLTAESDDQLRGQLADAGVDVGELALHSFRDNEAAVREDVTALRDDRRVPSEVAVSGWLYDVGSGELRAV